METTTTKKEINLLQEQTRFGLTKEELSKFTFLTLSKIAIDNNCALKMSVDIAEHGKRYTATMKVDFKEEKPNSLKKNFQILDFILSLCKRNKKAQVTN